MIYLDTHVVIWLYEGLVDRLSKKAVQTIEEHPIIISAMVSLEIQFLFESKKITKTAPVIVAELQEKIGLQICQHALEKITQKATTLHWTRDPFDRIIVANALVNNSPLLTKDNLIHQHFKSALW